MRIAVLAAALLVPVAAAVAGDITCVQAGRVIAEAPRSSAKSGSAPSILPLVMSSSRWSLGAQGTLVTGTLEVRFEPAGEKACAVLLGFSPQPGLRILGVEASAAGLPLPLEQDVAAAPPASPRAPQRRARLDEASAGRRYHAELPARADLIARFDVEMDAPLSSGAFRLGVAPVGSGCAGLERRPPPTTFELAVPHSGIFALEEDPAHALLVEQGAKAALIRWEGAEGDAAPLDFGWRLSSPDETAASAWIRERRDGSREISLVVTAPDAPDDAQIGAKDVVFLVDTSGSMLAAGKLDFARRAVSACLQTLRERDALNVIAFSEEVRPALPSPAAGDGAKDQAEAFLASLLATGGTRLAPALQEAFAQRRESGGRRIVVLLSDGILGDEEDVLALLRSSLGDAQLLVVSVGADARRDALRRLAELGRGESVVVSDPQALVGIMTSLLKSFGSPVAWNLDVDWGGADVRDVRPARLSDLNAGRPVTVRAIVDGAPPPRVRVRATTADGTGLDLDVPVESSPDQEP